MPVQQRTYIAIDLKSFYASVECVERGLDPLKAYLVVADESRTEKTICLAVSPALKAYGIGGRARLFEVVQRVREVNRERRQQWAASSAKSAGPPAPITYIAAKPRMGLYIKYSTKIYSIYLKYIAPEDIHVYSIDEVFIDATAYLATYKMTAHELAMTMIREVLRETGITATAGIGTNLYLAKVAMDIVAKHIPADKDGVRIAELDEMSYRRKLWGYTPLTAFWRVGRGTAQRLAQVGITTMGQLARFSLSHEEWFYKEFGVNAELLIDHAWGWEPCTIDQIKAYRPETNSISSGQVLTEPYEAEKARVVIQEMADQISLDLVAAGRAASGITLNLAYDRESLTRPEISSSYKGPVVSDYYGRAVPKPSHGSMHFDIPTSSSREITDAALAIYDSVVNKRLLLRRLNIAANNIVDESVAEQKRKEPVQLELFTDHDALEREFEAGETPRKRERSVQEAMLEIKRKFGKNAILKGISYDEGATARERNQQIGGHHE